jgi:hypothetical protein
MALRYYDVKANSTILGYFLHAYISIDPSNNLKEFFCMQDLNTNLVIFDPALGDNKYDPSFGNLINETVGWVIAPFNILKQYWGPNATSFRLSSNGASGGWLDYRNAAAQLNIGGLNGPIRGGVFYTVTQISGPPTTKNYNLSVLKNGDTLFNGQFTINNSTNDIMYLYENANPTKNLVAPLGVVLDYTGPSATHSGIVSDALCSNKFTPSSLIINWAGLKITNFNTTIDAQYPNLKFYRFANDSGSQNAQGTNSTYLQLDQVNNDATNSINILTGAQTIVSEVPLFNAARIKINYNSTVDGNPVGGLVFDGYYVFQSTDNRVVSLYSSTDLSTNLLISHNDSFASGALTLLGKTNCNIAGSTGIDTTSTHAGIFVKNLPFMNALFKSNPYVLLKPSGCVMFDNYGLVNSNILATSYFANKYVMSNGNVYSNKNNSFFSFSNFTFNYSPVSALPTVNALLPIDYTFFNSISQIKYNAKYNGAVLLDSYFVFYLDSSNNYHMVAQYPTDENKNVLLFSDSACDNFPNTGNFGNTLGTVDPDPTVSTIVAVSGDAATATVTTSTVSETGTPTITGSVTATGTVARVNLNALNSNICFSKGSIVSTDQGDVEIQNIDTTYHTICNNKIIALTETQSMEDYLVKIKKNALGNIPNKDTETTGNHMIFNGVSMVQAKTLINGNTIEKIPYRGLPLYNILLEQHNVMLVNGLVCETLNPENPIAKYYMLMAEHSDNKVEMENMWRKRTQEIIHPIC